MRKSTIDRLQQLVILLSDGQFHSGEAIAQQLGTSRTAVWKLIKKVKSWQIEVYSVRGKGYKIPKGLTLLDSEFLQQQISLKAKLFNKVTVLSTVDSTSSYLSRIWQQNSDFGQICISEHQSEGRGRKGNKWISPFGTNLYFSMGVNLPIGLSALGGLSLAIGIGISKLLDQYSNETVKLKWPNDLLLNGKKLAGILVEASGDSNDRSFLNIGIGINWDMKKESEIDQSWANLKDSLLNEVDRNQILAMILLEVDSLLTKYIARGFEPFREEWPSHSAYIGQPIVLHTRKGKVFGLEQGIDSTGAIVVKTENGERSYFSGEVSLRPRS